MDHRPQRPFQQRLNDTFDRSRIRHEVLKSKARRFAGLRRRYATLVLGASLAVGGIGVPMTASHMADELSQKNTPASATASAGTNTPGGDTSSLSPELQNDLSAAQRIAQEVSGAVTPSVLSPSPAQASLNAQSLKAIGSPIKAAASLTEQARESFFKSEVPFGSIIYNEAKKNDLSPELLAAVVKTESQFRPTARSGAGAQGLMQLVPKTGRWMGASNLMNPVQNVQAGAKYLRYLHDQFSGDSKKAIAAYNAGEGNVRRFNGVPPFRETQNYVSRVLNSEQDFKAQVSGRTAELADTAPQLDAGSEGVMK